MKIIQEIYNRTGAVDRSAGSATNIPDDNTKPTWAEVYNFADLDTTIQPTSINSTLRIEVTVVAGASADTQNAICLFQDPGGADECIVGVRADVDSNASSHTITFSYNMRADTIAATIFKIGMGVIGGAGDVAINEDYVGAAAQTFNSIMASSMRITEISR